MKRRMMVSDLIEALQDVANPESTPVYFEPVGNEDARIAIRSAYVSSRDVEPPMNADGSPNYDCYEFIFAISGDPLGENGAAPAIRIATT